MKTTSEFTGRRFFMRLEILQNRLRKRRHQYWLANHPIQVDYPDARLDTPPIIGSARRNAELRRWRWV